MSQKITLFVALVFLLSTCLTSAQIKKENLKLGFSNGSGKQGRFPLSSPDYIHDVDFYKVQLNYRFKDKRKWAFEINLEPSYNVVKHQLLNSFFIKASDADNFLELRELFGRKRTIKEYVLNMGVIARYKLYKGISTYAIGSVGPMIGDKETERLAKGFAFSDIFGLGVSYDVNVAIFDFRYSVRHTSNLEFDSPNSGHDTSNFECSVLFKL